jgi:spore germination cell wall hydrolase CwlJ-like protein
VESRFEQMCARARWRHADGAKSTQFESSIDPPDIYGAHSMPDIQADRSLMAPSILPADVPELSDDECIARLARAVETPDSARLDEVAALIGRLAVAIE